MCGILGSARRRQRSTRPGEIGKRIAESTGMTTVEVTRVQIPAGAVTLEGTVQVPDSSAELIILVSTDSDPMWRSVNDRIAGDLGARGFATLRVALVTAAEVQLERHDGRYHLDVQFLADRMCSVLGWLRHQPAWRMRPVGVVVSGNAAGGVLMAAAHHADQISGIVSLEGRADMAEDSLKQVHVRTLLLAAGKDTHLADLNRYAAASLPNACLEILRDATYRFDERRTLEDVVHRTGAWFAEAPQVPITHANALV